MVQFWQRFDHDPRDPALSSMRASDTDRDLIREAMGEAFAKGQLSPEEFDERTDHVQSVRTLGELPALVADLIPRDEALALRPHSQLRAEAEQRYRSARHSALMSMLLPSLITWFIYFAVLIGPGHTWFPWPVFVTLGTGWPWFSLVTDKEGSIQEIQRKAERKEQRRLERQRRRQATGKELGAGPINSSSPSASDEDPRPPF